MLLLEEAIYKSNPFTDYAIEHGLDKWDHYYFFLSLFLAIMTLTISSIALVVSCKTLKSQKITQKNTTPDINTSIQLKLCQKYFYVFFDTISDILALNYALIKTDFNTKPSPHYWSKFINPIDYLFEKVFYSEIKKFTYFMDFKTSTISFFNGIQRLKFLLENNSSKDEINMALRVLYDDILSISDNYLETLYHSFDIEQSKIYKQIPFYRDFSDGVKKWLAGDANIKAEDFDIKGNNVFHDYNEFEIFILNSLVPLDRNIFETLHGAFYRLYFHSFFSFFEINIPNDNKDLKDKANSEFTVLFISHLILRTRIKVGSIRYKDAFLDDHILGIKVPHINYDRDFISGDYILIDK